MEKKIFVLIIIMLMICSTLSNITSAEEPEDPPEVLEFQFGVWYDVNEFDDDYLQTLNISSIPEFVEPVISEDYVKDPYFEDGDQKWEIRDCSDWIAQEFTAASSIFEHFELYLSKSGYIPLPYAIDIHLREEISVGWKHILLPITAISESGGWIKLPTEPSELPFTAGEKYYLAIHTNFDLDQDEYVGWWYGTGNQYIDGKSWFSIDDDVTWTNNNDVDFNFRIWGYDEPIDPPGDPYSFVADNPTHNSIRLSWVKGSGSDKTKILRKTGGYPSSHDDPTATQVYFDTGISGNDLNLNPQTTYYYRAWAYASSTGLYSTGYDSDSETTLPTPYADIIITDIWTDPVDFEPGDTIGLYYTVKNQGTLDITNSFWIDTEFRTDYYGDEQVNGLAAGATENGGWDDFIWPDNRDTCLVKIIADVLDEVDESDDSNNENWGWFAAKLPNLYARTVFSYPISFGIGQTVFLYFNVTNDGEKDVDDSFNIAFYFDDQYRCEMAYDGLKKDGIIEDYFPISWPEDYNSYEVKFIVDCDGEIEELNDVDNEIWDVFNAVNQAPVSNELWGPTEIEDFDRIYVYHAIANDWEGDMIKYQFKFGTEELDWVPYDEYFESGKEIIYNWVWDEDDSGEVRVRAKDINGNIGEWSEPLNVEAESTDTCFLAGTQITMADRSYKNIEDIVVGDIVESFDRVNERIVGAKVTKIFHHSSEEMSEYYIIINKELKITPNHPLYINEMWKTADEVELGECLLSSHGEHVVIDSIEIVFQRMPTYNFEIESNNVGSHSCFAQGSLVTTNKDIVSVNMGEILLGGYASYEQLLT